MIMTQEINIKAHGFIKCTVAGNKYVSSLKRTGLTMRKKKEIPWIDHEM